MIYLLGGYMWLFIHRPFEVWPWLGNLHVERVYMLATIAYWAISVEKVWIKNRLNAAFVFFWLVVLAAWMASPYADRGSNTVENYFKVVVFYVLVISTVRSERNLKLLVIMFLGAMALYMAHSLWEYRNGRGVYRMNTWRMVGVDVSNGDPNSFAGAVVYALPMVYPLWSLVAGSRLRWALVGYVGLSATCVLLTGSRMGFVGLCSLALIVVLLSKRRLAVIALLAVVAPIAWNLLPEDRQNRFLTLWDPSYGPKGAQASAEGRARGFYDGVKLWKQNPLLGVGPGVFRAATGRGGQSHHLYGQVLGELGTLGALALAGIVLGIAGNMRDVRRVFRSAPTSASIFSYRVSVAVATTFVLLLVMGMGAHYLYDHTWLWFGAFQAIALHCLQQQRAEREAAVAPIRLSPCLPTAETALPPCAV
ncbi:O-antigen ligase family protein [archaeon]|nr:MAG: O-antigen ligase family protein [archaeon]